VLNDPLLASFRSVVRENLPFPGAGLTGQRQRRLFEVGREDLSLARLAEAHWDALAILQEAGREPKPKVTYAVWASEKQGEELVLEARGSGFQVSGKKMFCSGAGLVDRALVTVGVGEKQLVDIDLRQNSENIGFDQSDWYTSAFRETATSSVIFRSAFLSGDDLICAPGWYLQRAGFWHGACGPAACWAGGAAGLVDYAKNQSRRDSHTLAHFGAMYASVWAVLAYLDSAGSEIDRSRDDHKLARIRALSLRHLVEQTCTDILRRFARAYGPHPLAMDEGISRRYQELDLYLRQSHAERDLEALGRSLTEENASA
jgi:alkylation response protein AidB-like acyl-CoA dehydrogenase